MNENRCTLNYKLSKDTGGEIIATIESHQPSKDPLALPDIANLKNDLHRSISLPMSEQWVYIDGFLFTAEVLSDTLAKLAVLYELTVTTPM